MTVNIENFISAPDESLILKPDFDDQGHFTNLYIAWGEANVGVLSKGNEILKPKISAIYDDNLVNPSQGDQILKKIEVWFHNTFLKKIDLSFLLEKYNSTPEERSFIFKVIENQYNFYQFNILDEFKQIEENKRKEIHSLNFRLGKNVIFNSEFIRPELMKLKFYLWNIYNSENYNIDFYIPKDGNATLNAQHSLNLDLIKFLGFVFQNKLLIRIDIYNEFEKQLFKRENRGPFSLPMDLSNLLGIKKEKLIEILNERSYLIQEIEENDLLISKKINLNKKPSLKKLNKPAKKKNKKEKKSLSKKLFNNPFDQLKDINVK
tara:strand:- start:160 stop:1119 length:960 start_codon:yes stop_codon:yes gene_type:complete